MIFILFPFILLCFSQPVLSEPNFPEIPSKRKPFSISLQTEFFHSTKNYIEWNWDDLPDENYFQYIGFYPRIRHSPFPYISVQIFSQNFYAMSKTLDSRRNVLQTSLIGGGFSIYHKYRRAYLGFELKAGVPLNRGVLKNPDEMILGDGTYFAEPGVWLLLRPSRNFYLHYNSALRFRMMDLSSLWFNRLGSFLKTRHADFGASVDSFFSIFSDDRFSSQPQTRWELLQRVNGGSFKFRSVNPSALSFTAWIEFKFKPVFTKLYFNQDTFGKNYAKGFHLGLITTVKWNTKSSVIKRKRKTKSFDFDEGFEGQGSRSSSKGRSYFEEEDDPYNKEKINRELKQELRSLRH